MRLFPRYFEHYGGFNSVFKSPYFFVAALLSVVCSRYFVQPKWWDLVIAVVPGLVGFSIAGVAIFISLGSDSLRAVIAGKTPGSEKLSPFLAFMAMFTHFIVAQLIALITALIAKALYEGRPVAGNPLIEFANDFRSIFWFLGALFFFYAVTLCVALAVEIYRLAVMIDEFQTRKNNRQD